MSINGPMDHALRDIQTYALEDRGTYQTLVKNLRATGTGEIRKLDWKIKVIEVPINFATTFENSTRSAKKNRHYPFNFAKQFTRNAPFLLIFAFDHLFSKTLHVKFANCSSILFRSLCRRAFVQFKADKNAINSIGRGYAKKIDGTTKLCDVAKLLSGILFVNIQNNQSWLYTNPNAKNRLSSYDLEQIFDFAFPYNMEIDNFKYDNY